MAEKYSDSKSKKVKDKEVRTMEAIIAKYKAKILQRLDQEEPLSDEDLLAINDAIRVLARFEKASEKAAATAAAHPSDAEDFPF